MKTNRISVYLISAVFLPFSISLNSALLMPYFYYSTEPTVWKLRCGRRKVQSVTLGPENNTKYATVLRKPTRLYYVCFFSRQFESLRVHHIYEREHRYRETVHNKQEKKTIISSYVSLKTHAAFGENAPPVNLLKYANSMKFYSLESGSKIVPAAGCLCIILWLA